MLRQKVRTWDFSPNLKAGDEWLPGIAQTLGELLKSCEIVANIYSLSIPWNTLQAMHRPHACLRWCLRIQTRWQEWRCVIHTVWGVSCHQQLFVSSPLLWKDQWYCNITQRYYYTFDSEFIYAHFRRRMSPWSGGKWARNIEIESIWRCAAMKRKALPAVDYVGIGGGGGVNNRHIHMNSTTLTLQACSEWLADC